MSPSRFVTGLWLCLAPLSWAAAEELLDVRNPSPLQAESALKALEPWETPISGFFIRSHHGVPAIDESRWAVEIDGLVERPIRLSLLELKRMRKRSLHAVLQCAGDGRGLQEPPVPGVAWERGAVGNAEWTGVPLADLLAKAGPNPKARYLRLEGADKPGVSTVPAFVRSVLIDELPKDALLAWKMNRESLPALHGGPVRLVLPGWYGENWTKWLTRITLTEEEDAGYFMRKGYRMPKAAVRPGDAWDSATGEPIRRLRVQSILVAPGADETVTSGDILIAGKAFSGVGPVARVELSTDQGAGWFDAELEPQRPSGGWQSFKALIGHPGTGTLTVWSRATDVEGRTQPLEHDWNPGGYLRNAVDRVTFRVAEDWVAAGAVLYAVKCRTCHAIGLVESQRLTEKQWEGVLTKMEGFGAHLQADEREVLVRYLARLTPERRPPAPRRAGYDALARALEPTRGDGARGKKLYLQSCAVCHGPGGEGDTAPRLAGRALPAEDFYSAVREGRGEMPGFERLGASELSDIRRYLETR